MKLLLIIAFSILCLACSSEPELESAQLDSIRAEASELLASLPTPSFDIDISRKPTISALSPKSVYITNDGLYIQLDSGFSAENGLFIPREGKSVNTGTGLDPEYMHIDKQVYRYQIEG